MENIGYEIIGQRNHMGLQKEKTFSQSLVMGSTRDNVSINLMGKTRSEPKFPVKVSSHLVV